MNVLVLGSGGREHAIAKSLKGCKGIGRVFIAPGNGGMSDAGQCVLGQRIDDFPDLVNYMRFASISMVIIGPEAPLVAGFADKLRSLGYIVFGPGKNGAELEGSKTKSKQFMINNNLPTAAYKSFTNKEEALAFVDELGAPCVVKADGLAAGKGVVVAQNIEDAKQAVEDCFEGKFKEAGSRVVIEECLQGKECSMLALVSAGKAIVLPCAKDYKRAYDGGLGPNTGGMGALSPVPGVSEEDTQKMADIMKRAAAATANIEAEGVCGSEHCDVAVKDFRGVLYGGFMLTEDGPKLLEFNVRFGDPEAEVILPRIKNTNMFEVFRAIAEGRPDDVHIEFSDDYAVCVVLASGGYPVKYECDKPILGMFDASYMKGVHLYYAGALWDSYGDLVTTGGRVFDVTGMGKTLEQARELAYKACDAITFEGKQMRSDIASFGI